MIGLIFGKNKERIEKLCFLIQNFFNKKNCVIVHPLYYLEFKKEKIQKSVDNKNNLKNIYCFKRTKQIIKDNKDSVILIDNYVASIQGLENLIYNLNLSNIPITHFICSKEYYDKIKFNFDNLFFLDFDNLDWDKLKEYFRRENKIIKDIIQPKRVFITILFGCFKYNKIYIEVKHVIKRVYRKLDDSKKELKDFNEMVNKITNRFSGDEFFVIFFYKRVCYLFNLQNLNLFVVINCKDIYKFIKRSCLLLKLNKETNIGKLDFIIVKKYRIDGTELKDNTFCFENKIIRLV